MKESDCTGGRDALQEELADFGKTIFHAGISKARMFSVEDLNDASALHGERWVSAFLAGEDDCFLRSLVTGFLRQVAKFIKAQFLDMLHHVIAEIGLHGCFLLRCGTFYQREGQFILPEQMAVTIHEVQIEAS